MSTLRPLYDHQQTILSELRAAISGGSRTPMVQAPTGAGKTVLAAHMVAGGLDKGRRVAFCVPSLSLIDQTFERFVENGIEPSSMGIVQGDHPWRRPHAPAQICSTQTLTRRSLPDVDLVIIDEAHVRYEIYDKWMSESGYGPNPVSTEEQASNGRVRRPLFVGLSATPWAKGLGQFYDCLIKPTSISLLIDRGFLSPFRVFAPSHPDLEGVKTVDGDWHEGQLADRMSKATLVADVVSTWLAKANNEPTLCFCVNRAHAQAVAEQFAESGVSTAYVDANTLREERERIGRRLADGTVKVVVNIGCLTTGVDWDVRCISLCRPTKSKSLFVQIVGRGLRTAEGKAYCTILDHSDTHLRLGMVTDIDEPFLDDGRPKKKKSGSAEDEDKVRLPRECQSCAALVPHGLMECPCCGSTLKRPHGVAQEEGELTELLPGQKRKKEKAVPVQQQLREMGKESVIGQLYALQQQWGKTDSWVMANFREIFHAWPRGLDGVSPIEPTGVLRSWIRHRQIAWRKGAEGRRMREAA